MIIISNPHDQTSREFVAAYGEGHTILEMADCLEIYPAIPGGPCVPVHIPAYREPEQVIDGLTVPAYDVEAYDWIYAFPATMQEVIDFAAMAEQRAIDHPYGGGS